MVVPSPSATAGGASRTGDPVNGAAALGAGLVGADLARADRFDGQAELLLERAGDGTADGMVLPAGGRGDLLDRGASGRSSSAIISACLVPARGVASRQHRAACRRRAWTGRLAFFAVGRPANLAPSVAPSDVALVLRLDADGLEPGAGDPQRRRVVAAPAAAVLDQALALRLPSTLSTAPPLILSVSGSGSTAPSCRCEAALRITA